MLGCPEASLSITLRLLPDLQAGLPQCDIGRLASFCLPPLCSLIALLPAPGLGNWPRDHSCYHPCATEQLCLKLRLSLCAAEQWAPAGFCSPKGQPLGAATFPGRELDIEPGLPVHADLAQGSLTLLGSLTRPCSLAPFMAPVGEPSVLSLPAPIEQWDLRKTGKPHSHGPCLSEGHEGPGGQWLLPAGSTEIPVKESVTLDCPPNSFLLPCCLLPRALGLCLSCGVWACGLAGGGQATRGWRREVMPGGLVCSPGLAARVCSLSPSHHYHQHLQKRAGCPAGAASGASSSAPPTSGALQAGQRPLHTHQASRPDCGCWSTSPAWS